MNATAITTFYGARDGELYPTRFEPGDLIEGELAEIAVREKWAEETALEPDERNSPPSEVDDQMNQPLFEVVTPAPAGAARQLTTVEKVKAALRIADSANDALITSVIDGVSADCAREARLARAGATDPTFGRESLRATWAYRGRSCSTKLLVLPWRTPIISISSAVVGGDSLDAGGFRLVDGGMIERVGEACAWLGADTVVEFIAGWDLPTGVPAGLEMRVIDQVKMQYLQTDRDQSLRSQSTDGLGSATYAVIGGDSIGKSGLLKSLEAALAPYTSWTV